VKIPVGVFSVVMPCNVAVGYCCFRGPCCLHLHGEVKLEAARSAKVLVSYHNTRQPHDAGDLESVDKLSEVYSGLAVNPICSY